jgi:hypothetical protein
MQIRRLAPEGRPQRDESAAVLDRRIDASLDCHRDARMYIKEYWYSLRVVWIDAATLDPHPVR